MESALSKHHNKNQSKTMRDKTDQQYIKEPWESRRSIYSTIQRKKEFKKEYLWCKNKPKSFYKQIKNLRLEQ